MLSLCREALLPRPADTPYLHAVQGASVWTSPLCASLALAYRPKHAVRTTAWLLVLGRIAFEALE